MRFETLRKIAAALSQDQSLTLLLQQIVREVGHYRAVAIARIWLFEPARQCEICRAKPETRDLPPGLHLAASAGRPLKPGEDWGRIDDDVHGGGAKIQRISDHRQPLLIKDIRSDPEWQESPGWSGERIRGFAGFPLVFAGAEVGVIAVFSRAEIKPLEFERLRVLAVALAGTIVNTRASTEINHLRARLESENAYLREEASEVAGGTGFWARATAFVRFSTRSRWSHRPMPAVLILGETGVEQGVGGARDPRAQSATNRRWSRLTAPRFPANYSRASFLGM